jgi:hypothetical protein
MRLLQHSILDNADDAETRIRAIQQNQVGCGTFNDPERLGP